MPNPVILLLALQAAPASGDVFVSGREGYHGYRAFCEGRKDGRSDTGDIDLVLRRSADGGATWGPIQVVWDDGPDPCGNPCAVVDRDTGTIDCLHEAGGKSACEKVVLTRVSLAWLEP